MAWGKFLFTTKKIITCDFSPAEINNQTEINTNNCNTSNIQELYDNRLSSNPNLICFENEEGNLQRGVLPVMIPDSKKVASQGTQTQSIETFIRTSQQVDNLSKTFKEYIQQQFEILAEESRSFDGTISNSEFKRLQTRIYKELTTFKSMEIYDPIFLTNWDSKVRQLLKELTYNATQRRNRRIQFPTLPSEKQTIYTITPVHQPVPVLYSRNTAKQKEDARRLEIKEEMDKAKQKEEEARKLKIKEEMGKMKQKQEEARRLAIKEEMDKAKQKEEEAGKLKIKEEMGKMKQKQEEARKLEIKEKMDSIHQKLILLSNRVFNFCDYWENSEYLDLESHINSELKSLQSIQIADSSEFSPRKVEIEQFGRLWLIELHRRLEEMKIRKYEARIKDLW